MADDTDKQPADLFEAPLTAEALEDYFWDIRDASREMFHKIRKRFERNYSAYGCVFLSETERQYLKDTDRPPVELNLLTSKMNAVLGSIAAGQMECQFKPHTSSMEANVIAGWMTLLLRKAMIDCGGFDQIDEAMRDCLLTGYGAAEVYLDTSRLPHRGVLRQVPLEEVDPDPEAREKCLGDRTFDYRHREWLVEQVYASYPQKKAEIEQHVNNYGTFRPTGKAGAARRQRSKDTIRGRVEVGQLIYQRWVSRVRWYDPELQERRDTRPEELEKRRKELGKVADANGAPMFEEVVEERYLGETWYRATFLVGQRGDGAKGSGSRSERAITLLDHVESPRLGSTILWVTGLPKKDPVRKRVEYFNLLDIAYGLQMVLNRTVQEELAILAREAKGGARYADEAVPDDYPGGPEKWAKDQSKPGSMTRVAAEGWDLYEAKELPRIPSGLDRLEEKLVNWIGQATAITEAFVGSVEREQSAVSLSNLQQQGLVTLGPVLGPYVKFVKDAGIALVEILIRHLPAKDIDRILGDPQVEGMTFELDPETGEQAPMMMDDPDDPGTEQEMMDPMTGEPTGQMETVFEQIPITAGYLLKQENPLDYQVNVDTGQLTVSLRYAIWEIFQQGVLQTMQNALGPAAFQKLALFMVKNMPVPGEAGATLAKDIEVAMEQEQALQTQEGVVEYLLSLGPDGALPVLQQVEQQLGMAGGEAPAEGGQPPEETMVQ